MRLHEHARTGEAVAVRGPRNTFPFHGSGRSLLIAGGIGITPLILMIDEAKRNGIDWELVYLGRRLIRWHMLIGLRSRVTA